MELIYKWQVTNYKWIIETNNIKWLWSNKKNKYYSKLEDDRFLKILFKDNYVIVFDKWEPREVEPMRNYYYVMKEWLSYEITPKIEMPF